MRSGVRPGFFYVVQLLPDLSPTRLKFGFAQDMRNRMWGYKYACPHAQQLVAYPALSTDEHLAIATVTGSADVRLSAEVFEVASVNATLERVHKFFEWTTWVDDSLYALMLSKASRRPFAVDYLTDIRDPESTLRQAVHSDSLITTRAFS